MQWLILAFTVLFVLIAWMRLSSATLILCALLPAYLLRAEFFGIPTTLLELMVLSLFVVWLIKRRGQWKNLFQIDRRFAMALVLLVLAATISAIIAPDTLAALGIWKAYFIEPIFFFYLLVDLLKREEIKSEKIAQALLLGGGIVAVVATAQWIFSTGIPIPWDYERRVTGIFDYPNALGLYLGPLVILAISLSSRGSLNRLEGSRIFYVGSVLLFLIAIILAQSEAALAAIVITVILMGLLQKTWRKKTILTVGVLAIILCLIPTTRTFLLQKATLQDYSGQVRLGQWKETGELLKDHWFLGVGLSGYPTALVPYHKQTHIEIFQYPHNIFLNIWVELGLLGLVAFFVLSFVLLFPREIMQFHFPLLPIAYCLLPLLTMFIHGLVDVPYFKNDLAMMTWIFIALLYAESFSKNQSTSK